MRVLTFLILLLVPCPIVAQEPKGKSPLYTFLQAEAKKHFDARRQVIANLKTPEAIHKRQADLKEKFLAALGGFPDKTPLNPKLTGVFKGDGFRIEKVIYESRPQHHVTANLYLPDSKSPVPGVLLPCGHSDNGKAAEANQRMAMLLARHGMAALCYDPIGQGERNQLLDKTGKPLITGTNEHTMVGIGALLVGQCTATYRIWDGMRSLDYLASRPEIDPTRLGCTGNSGGGTMTAYLMALDERIAAAVPSCYLTTLEKLIATIGPQDAEQNITGQVAFGMEHADYLTMRAPKPTLMAVATHDFFNIDGAWTTFREASKIYGKLGHGERVALFEFEDKHGFSRPRREAALRWLRRWLVGKDDAPSEGAAKIFSDAQLQCTGSGQVLEEFHGISVFQLNRLRAMELAKKRPSLTLEAIRELLNLPSTRVGQPREARFGMLPEPDDIILGKGELMTEPGWHVPMAMFGRDKKISKMTILVSGSGFATETGPDGIIPKLVKAGRTVVAADLRGQGSTASGKPPSKRRLFGNDENEAFLGILLNRPLLGQRVHDLLCLVDYWSHKGADSIEVVAIGSAGPSALHAAALDKRISKLVLEKSLVSWQNVVDTPLSLDQLTNVVPRALRDYDLPDLAALVAPRPLTIRGTVDARGQPVAFGEMEDAYKKCREKYGTIKAAANLVLEK